ncbi:Spy/CpxP family protein refolding chaperone [Rhodoblastus acidophilus]|uniref:Spy/CpxP family protein refolding chaperone n=1 Tax=Rhodoblastus acidophilus TaxID=1074 RepID=UPI002224B8F9|nr:Spy/CpxP family protein refolding chaperone [Rhodoblastus acidophilus]MCW2285704.1 Spy/CpxP family protein refolding chaperone [Rhodoblastus acidophilus]MCW2333076.1 Spy/CpxP family protein refolding chaperone [Rhodoblastus acidophilus]
MRVFRIASLALACGFAAYAMPPAQAGWDGPGSRHERFCADEKFAEHFADMQKRRADQLAERLKLTDAQKAAFKDVQAVRAKSVTDNRAAVCAANPANLSFEKRLEFRQARLQARLDALKAETPKLLAFYNSLDERQKGQFEEISRHQGHHGPHGGMGEGGPGMMGAMMHGGPGPHEPRGGCVQDKDDD